MSQTKALLIKVFLGFCCLVAFCISAELFLAWASEVTGIERLASLQAKDLLGSLGVFGTLSFTIASRKAEMDKLRAEEEAELERAEPQLDVAISNATCECVVTVANLGPTILECLTYEDQVLTESLLPGSSFRFVLTGSDPDDYDEVYREQLPKLVWSSYPIVDGYPTSLLLCVYDCKKRLWAVECKYKDGEMTNCEQWLAT